MANPKILSAERHQSDRLWWVKANAVANCVLLAGATLALFALWRQLVDSGVVGEQPLGSSVAWKGRTLM
jgi:hypothetical protein